MRTLIGGLVAASAIAAAQSPLTTTFATNNAGSVGGNVYFDLTASVPLTIIGLDLDFTSGAGTAGSVEVYTCPATRVGNQTLTSAWTLVSTGTATAAGSSIPTAVAITPFALPVGTVGVALKAINLAHAYTNGTGSNQTASTLELTLAAGEASNVPFTAPLFTPRVVNCNIHYAIGTGTTATVSSYGAGCVDGFASFYESFATAPAFDLSNSALSLLSLGPNYIAVLGLTGFLAPSPGATALPLTDDSETTVTLAAPFPFPGGSTTTLTVCSNGFVSVATGNGIGFTPAVATMLGAAETAWWSWHDYLPSGTGPAGQVLFEQRGALALVTWNAVADFGVIGSASTWQMQFDTSTGSVHLAWQSMSGTGNGHLVGYSPGGPSRDPGSRDLSAAVSAPFLTGVADVVPLHLAATSRPVTGTTCTLTTTNIPGGTPFGAVLFGAVQFVPGIDLTSIGMPGCFRHTDGQVSLLFFPAGASHTLGVPIPAATPIGLQAFAQSATFSPPLTPLGFISANAVALTVGNQ